MNDDDKFKLLTRRWLALLTVVPAVGTICFITAWGAIYGQLELVTLGVGMLGGSVLGAVLTTYFTRRISEE